jgi:hypothetical protein
METGTFAVAASSLNTLHVSVLIREYRAAATGSRIVGHSYKAQIDLVAQVTSKLVRNGLPGEHPTLPPRRLPGRLLVGRGFRDSYRLGLRQGFAERRFAISA